MTLDASHMYLLKQKYIQDLMKNISSIGKGIKIKCFLPKIHPSKAGGLALWDFA